jgi:hypothetical protein
MMDPSTPGLWLLSTRGRVKTSLPKTLESLIEMGIATPGVVLVNDRDYAENVEVYDALTLPERWTLEVVGGDTFPEKNAWALAELTTPDMQWYGWLSDDVVAETPNFDAKMLAHLNGYNFITVNDRLHAPQKMGACVIFSADLIRAVGYMDPSGFRHFFVDDIWETIGRDLGVWACDMTITVRHEHSSRTGRKDSTTLKVNDFFDDDHAAFQAWMKDERHPVTERVLAMMEERGVQMIRPDFTGMKIMLAAPCGDGRFDRVFMRSYVETRDAVKHYGGELILAELPFQSAVDVARNTLFSNFLRSDCTHCFWIDSDQGWKVRDFVRLLVVKKDFVAAAGVKKTSPPSFAVSVSDEHGNAVGINYGTMDLGLIEVTHVGFAFACVTREWATRMSQHYADLAYENLTRTTDYGVFMPMVWNKRYFAEDFAACQRWLNIGGKIHVAPEISLEHVGTRVFTGSWLEELVEQGMREREEDERQQAAAALAA